MRRFRGLVLGLAENLKLSKCRKPKKKFKSGNSKLRVSLTWCFFKKYWVFIFYANLKYGKNLNFPLLFRHILPAQVICLPLLGGDSHFINCVAYVLRMRWMEKTLSYCILQDSLLIFNFILCDEYSNCKITEHCIINKCWCVFVLHMKNWTVCVLVLFIS